MLKKILQKFLNLLYFIMIYWCLMLELIMFNIPVLVANSCYCQNKSRSKNDTTGCRWYHEFESDDIIKNLDMSWLGRILLKHYQYRNSLTLSTNFVNVFVLVLSESIIQEDIHKLNGLSGTGSNSIMTGISW